MSRTELRSKIQGISRTGVVKDVCYAYSGLFQKLAGVVVFFKS